MAARPPRARGLGFRCSVEKTLVVLRRLCRGRVRFDGSSGGLRWGGGVDGWVRWDKACLEGFGLWLRRPAWPIGGTDTDSSLGKFVFFMIFYFLLVLFRKKYYV